jgi:hypothetical protein
MEARCRISTLGEKSQTAPLPLSSQALWPTLNISADSKTLNGLKAPAIHRRQPLIYTLFANGLERASVQMPANTKTFHPEAARREL